MLSPEFQQTQSIMEAKTPDDLAKMLISAQSMIGRDKVVLPPENATDEQLSEFYNKLGRPEVPEGYKFEMPKDVQLPEGFEPDVQMTEHFRGVMHKHGLTQEQAAGLYAEHIQYFAGLNEQVSANADQQYERDVQTLKQEFGEAFDQNIAAANNVLKKIDGGDKVTELLKNAGLANDPTMVKFLYGVAKSFGDDTLRGGGESNSFIMTPAEAKGQVTAYQNNPDFMKAYQDKSHPNHQANVAEMERLFKLAHPEQDPYNVG